MVSEKELEDFDYEEGEIEDLRRRALIACSFVLDLAGWENRAREIANVIQKSDDEGEIGRMIRFLVKMILKKADNSFGWAELYEGLFGDSLFIMESHYIPEPKEVPDIVRKCLQEKKRVRTDLPEGARA